MSARMAIALIVALTVSHTAVAAQRIYCAADDANVRMSLESGFSSGAETDLTHFRGALTLKNANVPGLVQAIRLESSMLRKHHLDDRQLRLQVYAEAAGDPFATLELTVDTAATAQDPSHFEGGYVVKVRTGPKRTGGKLKTAFAREGRLLCELK